MDKIRPGSITVNDLIMIRLHNDQHNLIIVKADDFEEVLKLTSDLTELPFKIK